MELLPGIIPMTFGERIETQRIELNLSQSKLAELVGIGQPFLSKLERNLSGLEKQPEVVGKLEPALELKPGELLALLPENSMARRMARLPTLHPHLESGTRSIPYWGEVSAGSPVREPDGPEMRIVNDLPRSGDFVCFTLREAMLSLPARTMIVIRVQPSAEHGEASILPHR